jgi:hypothetical protein
MINKIGTHDLKHYRKQFQDNDESRCIRQVVARQNGDAVRLNLPRITITRDQEGRRMEKSGLLHSNDCERDDNREILTMLKHGFILTLDKILLIKVLIPGL